MIGRSHGADERTLFVLAGARILLGVLWLANLTWKLPPDFGRDDPEGLLYNFELASAHAVVAPLRTLAVFADSTGLPVAMSMRSAQLTLMYGFAASSLPLVRSRT